MANRAQDIIQRIGIEGAEQVLAQMRALGKEGSAAFKELQAAVDEANKSLTQLGPATDEAGQAADDAAEGYNRFGLALTTIVGTIAAAGAALTALVTTSGNAIRELSGTADALGLTANELQRLEYQARLAGVEGDVLSRALANLQTEAANTARAEREQLKSTTALSTSYIRGAVNAREYLASKARLREQILALVGGNEEAADAFYRLGFAVRSSRDDFQKYVDNPAALAERLRELAGANTGLASTIKDVGEESRKSQTVFERLGISVLDAAGNQRPLLDLYDELMETLSGMANETERNQLALEAFGVDGLKMVRIMQNYRDGANEAAEALHRLNLNLSPQDQANAEAWGRAMGRIGGLLDGLRLKIGAALLPAWTALAEIMGDWIERIAPGLVTAVQAFADGVTWAVDQIGLVSSILLNILGPDTHGNVILAADAFVALGVAAGVATAALTLFRAPLALLLAGLRLIPAAFRMLIGLMTGLGGGLRVAAGAVLALAGAFGGLPAILVAAGAAVIAFLGYLAYENWDAIKQAALDTWNYIRDTATGIWDTIKARWNTGVENVKAIINTLTTAAQTVWDGIKQGAIAVWDELPAAWERGVESLSTILAKVQTAGQATNEALVALALELWEQINAAYNEGVETVKAVWDSLKENASAGVEQVTDSASRILESLTNLATTALDAIAKWIEGEDTESLNALATAANEATTAVETLGSTTSRIMSQIVSATNSAIAAMNSLANAARAAEAAARAANAAAAAGKAQGGPVGGGGGYSLGGPVWGGGNSTSDSIFARLSRGEYVIRAAAVLKYGRRLFDMLNNMLLDINLVKGFNVGGLIEASMPKYQSPAAIMGSIASDVKPKTPLLLQLPSGEILPAGQLDDNAVDQLLKHTIGKGLRSLGRVIR
jgi:hypothetical protein